MPGDTATAEAKAPFLGWRMVALALLILNCALGVNFAAYGTMVESIQREFQTSRALAVSGASMLTLTMGLLSPWVGGLIRRVSLRTMMIAGALLNGGGYIALSFVHDIFALLAIYAILIGPGFTLLGVIPCTALVSNWFVSGRGRALGIINMPFGNALLPLVFAQLVVGQGLRVSFLVAGALLLGLIPPMLLLVDRPERIGQRPLGHDRAVAAPAAASMTTGQILRSTRFLVLTLAVGTLSAAGLVMVTNLVALGQGRGLDLGSASLLLSAFGIAGVVGAPLFGWIADRVGGRHAFAILALAETLPWLALLVTGHSLATLLPLAFLIGLCCNAILPLFGTAMAEWLGEANLGLAMGLCYLLQIPFMFGAAPLAGAMFDATGGYDATILLHVASFVAVGLLFLLYRPVPALIRSSPSAA
jgi:MFS family permease